MYMYMYRYIYRSLCIYIKKKSTGSNKSSLLHKCPLFVLIHLIPSYPILEIYFIFNNLNVNVTTC